MNKILLVIVLVVAIGGYFLYQNMSSNKVAPQQTQQVSNESQDYFNAIEKVKFKYPSDWKMTYSDAKTPIKATFTKEKIASFVFVSQDFQPPVPTLDVYTKDSMNQISNVPDYKLIEQADITVNNTPFHKVVYNNSASGKQFITLQIWTVKNSKGYGFSYTAVPEKYNELLPTAQNIITSIEVF